VTQKEIFSVQKEPIKNYDTKLLKEIGGKLVIKQFCDNKRMQFTSNIFFESKFIIESKECPHPLKGSHLSTFN